MSGSPSQLTLKSPSVGGRRARDNEESYVWTYVRSIPGWESLRNRFSSFRLGGLLSCTTSSEIAPGTDEKGENGKKSKRTTSEENSNLACSNKVKSGPSSLEQQPHTSSPPLSKPANRDRRAPIKMSATGSCECLKSLSDDPDAYDTSLTCAETKNRDCKVKSSKSATKRGDAKFSRDDSVSLWNLRESLEGTTLLFHGSPDEPSTGRGNARDANEEIAENSDASCSAPLLRPTKSARNKNLDSLTSNNHTTGHETAIKKRQAYAKRYYVISGNADDVISSDSETKENAYCEVYSDYENNDRQPQQADRGAEQARAAHDSWRNGRSIKLDPITNDHVISPSFYTEKKATVLSPSRYEFGLEVSSDAGTSGIKNFTPVDPPATDPSPCCSTCSGSSASGMSEGLSKMENESAQNDTTSTDSPASSPSNIRSGSIRSFTRIFRRSSSKRHISSQLLCGYSMDRDYCVDQKTDRIFKSYLKPDAAYPNSNTAMTSPRSRSPMQSNNIAQLRRQVMRKQYSDSIAVYYGQRMRRWRVKKQRSDSVNCPVDRAVLQRQDRIDEEFDPSERSEKLLPTRESGTQGSIDERKRLSDFEKYFPEKHSDLSWRGPR